MTFESKPFRIDIHQHCFPPEYKKVLDVCDYKVAAMMDAPMLDWSLENHLAMMDAAGIMTGMLSITGGFVYSPVLVRNCNEYFARVVGDHPSRLGAFAVLPFPDVNATLREIEYALDVLKLDGVGLLTNVNGHYLADPEYAPIFDELNRRKVLVCIHPNDPPYGDLSKIKVPWAMVEYPLETTRTMNYMLHGGTLKRCPEIKFILPHAGGAIPFLAMRCANFSRNTELLEPLQSQYYDTAGASNRFIFRSLQEFVVPSHILFGTDLGMAEAGPAKALRMIKYLHEYNGFSKEDLRKVERDNALELFPRLKCFHI